MKYTDLTDTVVRQIISRHDSGETFQNIAGSIGVTEWITRRAYHDFKPGNIRLEAKRNKEKLIISEYNKNISFSEIAENLNLSREYVREICKKNGLTDNPSLKQRKILSYRKEGFSAREISRKIGVGYKTVYRVCEKYGAEFTENEKLAAKKANHVALAKKQRKTDAEFSFFFSNIYDDWEYIDGYSGTDGYANIRCLKCGTIIKKSAVSIRHRRNLKCQECQKRYLQKIQEEKDAKRKLRQGRRREQFNYTVVKQLSFSICKNCGEIFVKKGGQRYCSDKCRNNTYSKIKDGYRYDFPLLDLYKRDKGICYICGAKCDYNDVVNKNGVLIFGNMYPSRDHIIPKSKGGINSWDNLRLAHRICNSRKGASIG